MGRPKSKLSSLTDAELLAYCRRLYEAHGPIALTYKFLNDQQGLYSLLFARGFKQKRLAAVLGLEHELRQHTTTRPMIRAGRAVVRRTWSQLVAEACQVTKEYASLPPAQWFQRNGCGLLCKQFTASGIPGINCETQLATRLRVPLSKAEMGSVGVAIRKQAFPIFLCTRYSAPARRSLSEGVRAPIGQNPWPL